MIEPPRFTSWLLEATLLPDAEVIAADLLEEFQERAVTRGGRMLARCWYVWQVTRSLAPLFYRSWQRAAVTRASVALIVAAAVATLPAAALLSLRSFALSQVPLKTTPELSALFAVLLLAVSGVSALTGLAIGARLLNRSRT
jgi:hypothetical protein